MSYFVNDFLIHFRWFQPDNNSLPLSNITDGQDNMNFYLGIYGGLAAINSVFAFFRAFLFAYGGLKAAKVIHNDLLKTMLKVCTLFSFVKNFDYDSCWSFFLIFFTKIS